MSKSLDIPYFREKLSLVVRDLESYARSPADLARQLVRYARVADEKAAVEECLPKSGINLKALEQGTFEKWLAFQLFASPISIRETELAKSAWEAAQPKWKPIKDAPLNKRILAAMKGDEPDICKLSLSPSGILVAQLDCGSRYNAKSSYEVYMELPKPPEEQQ